jgi:hypothetical protein
MTDLEETVRETFRAQVAHAPQDVDLLARVRQRAGRRRVPPWGTGAVAAAVAVVMITVAGHASRQGQPAGPAAVRVVNGPALCHDIGLLERLFVVRSNLLPGNSVTFGTPNSTVLTDSPAVRSLARSLCDLRPLPDGVLHCPVDRGIAYRLVFSAADRSYPAITARAGGCEPVSGLGATRWGGEPLPTALGTALRWPRPYATQFYGRTPS